MCSIKEKTTTRARSICLFFSFQCCNKIYDDRRYYTKKRHKPYHNMNIFPHHNFIYISLQGYGRICYNFVSLPLLFEDFSIRVTTNFVSSSISVTHKHTESQYY